MRIVGHHEYRVKLTIINTRNGGPEFVFMKPGHRERGLLARVRATRGQNKNLLLSSG